jgi:uncharacterized protein (TIGR03067 family)
MATGYERRTGRSSGRRPHFGFACVNVSPAAGAAEPGRSATDAGVTRVMRLFFWVVATSSLVLVPACSGKGQDEQSKNDHAALQGQWEIVSAESNGEPPPPGLLDGAKFAFSGDKLTLLGKEGTFELDAGKRPRQIDFIRGKTRQIGIYELDGDSLKLCVGPADDRPKQFNTKPRTDHSLFILKRKKSLWNGQDWAPGVAPDRSSKMAFRSSTALPPPRQVSWSGRPSSLPGCPAATGPGRPGPDRANLPAPWRVLTG